MKELINLLQEQDQEMPVVVDSEDGYSDLLEIVVEKVYHVVGVNPETNRKLWDISDTVVLRG